MPERALLRSGLCADHHNPVSFDFDGTRLEDTCCVDRLGEERVLIETRSVETLVPIHHKQLLTYRRLLEFHAGILVNLAHPT